MFFSYLYLLPSRANQVKEGAAAKHERSTYFIKRTRKFSLTLKLTHTHTHTHTLKTQASKVWDDLSMINADFAQICGHHFSLQQINEMELVWLTVLKYDCKVSLSTYAKYYFKLRVMLGADGLRKGAMAPLSVQGALKLQFLSKEYGEEAHLAHTASAQRMEADKARAMSLENFSALTGRPQPTKNEGAGAKTEKPGVGACLEQLVNLEPQLRNTWSIDNPKAP